MIRDSLFLISDLPLSLVGLSLNTGEGSYGLVLICSSFVKFRFKFYTSGQWVFRYSGLTLVSNLWAFHICIEFFSTSLSELACPSFPWPSIKLEIEEHCLLGECGVISLPSLLAPSFSLLLSSFISSPVKNCALLVGSPYLDWNSKFRKRCLDVLGTSFDLLSSRVCGLECLPSPRQLSSSDGIPWAGFSLKKSTNVLREEAPEQAV